MAESIPENEITNNDMKRQQLYIKNKNGRYEPYKPEVDLNTAYRKVGNKYVPFAVVYHEDWLNDGVFVVRCDTRGSLRSFAETGYLQECFRIDKVGHNYRITADQLASLEDYVDFCLAELKKFETERKSIGISPYEKMQAIIGSVFKFSSILKEKMEKEHSPLRSPEDSKPSF